MIVKYYEFSCDDCKKVKAQYKDKDEAKAYGWALARGEKICYCPACAFKHGNTGKLGAKSKAVIEGQISISEVQDSA